MRRLGVVLPRLLVLALLTVRAYPERPDMSRSVRHSFSRALLLAASVSALAACSSDAPAAEDGSRGASPLTVRKRTPVYVADVVREYPHDKEAFTQGLLWHDGQLYESTGQVGKSNIRRVALETGAVQQQRDLASPHFGEGIALLNDRIYQLTWTSGKAFVYDRRTFEPRGEFTYEGEGWGITTDGSQLIMSDGTSQLRVLDPATFDVVRRVTVTENGSPVRYLNELEWVKGELWANVWMSDRIARIDPQSGAILGFIDLTGLLPQSLRTGNEDVLNGIAYDATGDRIFVTGKNWARLYEITLRLRD
jgi:glutamine cyclotransferase